MMTCTDGMTEPTLIRFAVGDLVTWTSQSGGFTKTKTGRIVAIVPPRTLADKCLPVGFLCNSTAGYGGSRDHESYLVQIGTARRLYWPVVNRLEHISAAEAK